MQPLWFRDAVIYQIDPATFLDSDGDGWGDLDGISSRLPYVRGLGANCIWLLPFYATPYRDGGYDVTDHLAVDPRFGDLADFARLMDRADSLGLRVIIDLVAQHTSVSHPWFQSARSSRTSPYRDYYIWSDHPEESDVEPIFPDVEDSVWTWDDEAGQYYRHVFYSHEPDLDLSNVRVRQEVERIMAFWLRLGVAGFRVDAVPSMVSAAGGLWLLEQMREYVTLHRPETVLIGEADVSPDCYDDYLGDSDRLTMLLDFWVDNHIFLALARSSAEPVERALAALPPSPKIGQYAHFLRNHDELDLEQLTPAEREEVMSAFGADEAGSRLYGRGIRRRLAGLLDGDQCRIAMAHALLLSLPGAPVLLYGDEIGLGDDLSRPERMAVRTPMQWSSAPGAGFSSAPASELVAAPAAEGRFGYRSVNVYDQTGRPGSLLSQVSALVRARLGCSEIGTGCCSVVPVPSPSVLCLLHGYDSSRVITCVNLAPDPVSVSLRPAGGSPLVDVVMDRDYPAPLGDDLVVDLDGYGYRWLRSV